MLEPLDTQLSLNKYNHTSITQEKGKMQNLYASH